MIQLAMKAVPTPLAIVIILALTTGMRRGELCALRGVRNLIAYLNSQPAEVVPIARLEDAS